MSEDSNDNDRSMSEEVKSPATQVPKAMIGATILNFLIKRFHVPLVFVLPDIQALINDPYAQPEPVVLPSAVGNEAGAFVLALSYLLSLSEFCAAKVAPPRHPVVYGHSLATELFLVLLG